MDRKRPKGPETVEQIDTDVEIILGNPDESIYSEDTAVVGKNKGQLFVRIPKIINDKIGLQAGEKIRFVVAYGDKGPYLELIRDGK